MVYAARLSIGYSRAIQPRRTPNQITSSKCAPLVAPDDERLLKVQHVHSSLPIAQNLPLPQLE